MRARIWVALALVAGGCPTSTNTPGDEQLGSFAFHAEPPAAGVYVTCGLPDVPDAGFDFTAAFSHTRDGGNTWVSIGGVAHPATFVSSTIQATYSAPRSFQECSTCGTTVTEVMTVLLLSQSQDQALGGVCPAPGVAPPLDPDAGITAPMSASAGFDAVRGCGTLADAVASDPVPGPGLDGTDAGCWSSCNACALSYVLTGERQ